MTHQSQAPADRSINSFIFRWLQKVAAPLLLPKLQECKQQLEDARADLSRLNEELDDMANIIEGKDRQIRASAEALAKANADAARNRRAANELQGHLDSERRFIKQMHTQLSAAKKNQKRR